MKTDLGIENLTQEYAKRYDVETDKYLDAAKFYEEFNKYIKVVNTVSSYSIKNYNNTAEAGLYTTGNDNPIPRYVLPDGSSVGRRINGAAIHFWVDINGPKKGPNRYGFDVFEFQISSKKNVVVPVKPTKLYTEEELESHRFPGLAGYPCSTKSKQELNGMGCSYYAVNDINPDDETKKYWESLPW